MKTITIRMSDELAKWLALSGNTNKEIISNLEAIKKIRAVSTSELKGMFTPGEWKFFVDSLNGIIIDTAFRCNASMLEIMVGDEELSFTAEKWDVDVEELINKIKMLKGANVDALYSRVETFWDNPSDLDEWSNF
ncbi:MAG: hypothetical protein RR319_01195 [Bacteroides sp.]